MQSLIDASISATVAALMEQMHKIAQVGNWQALGCGCVMVVEINRAT